MNSNEKNNCGTNRSFIISKEAEKLSKNLLEQMRVKRESFSSDMKEFLDKDEENKPILEKMLFMNTEVDSMVLLLKRDPPDPS